MLFTADVIHAVYFNADLRTHEIYSPDKLPSAFGNELSSEQEGKINRR